MNLCVSYCPRSTDLASPIQRSVYQANHTDIWVPQRRSSCGNISAGTRKWPDILIRPIYYSCAFLQGYKPIPISNVNPHPSGDDVGRWMVQIAPHLSGFLIQVAMDVIYSQIVTTGTQDEWIPHSLSSSRNVVLINAFELLNRSGNNPAFMSCTCICWDDVLTLYVLAINKQILAHLPINVLFFPLTGYVV